MKSYSSYVYQRIVESKLFIDENYTDEISIGQIAAEACFSQFHFLRVFRQVYQITPHQYLTALRIRKAKKLLQDGILIGKTCSMVGFASMSSFTKLFKRHVKLTPSAYAVLMKELHLDRDIHPLAHVPQCFVEYMHWNK